MVAQDSDGLLGSASVRCDLPQRNYLRRARNVSRPTCNSLGHFSALFRGSARDTDDASSRTREDCSAGRVPLTTYANVS